MNFESIPKNSRIVLYGTGEIGRKICSEIIKINHCQIMLWLDQKADGFLVKKPETIANLNADDYDIVIIAIQNKIIANDVKKYLMYCGVPESKIQHRIDIYFNLDDQQKNILLNFQCKTDLNDNDINSLLQSARQKDIHFSAQVAQDVMAYLFFNGKTDGFYIDIGANDGYNGSTTFWAEQLGWKGICVEPQKITFADMMKDFPDTQYIDFLSIDTEGHEMQVLQSIDFDKYKFGLITIETADGSDVVKFIENNGYKKLMVAGSDCLFVPKDYKIPVSCAVSPFEIEMNKYTELMKNILQIMNIKPTNNLANSDFVWLHWFENVADKKDFQQKTDFLKKCEENGQKIIWNVHNKQPHEMENPELVKSLMKSLADSAYKIIIHSKITKQIIKELSENNENVTQKIVLVPHPHYAGVYGNLIPQNSLSNDKLKILFFGLIRPYKNIELLIKVFNDLNFDDFELNICGDCRNENYKRELFALVKAGNIKTDFRFIADSEIPQLLAQSHILLLPYSLESSLNSAATILAFSYSRSVISSLTGTLDDVEDKTLFFAYDYQTSEEHEQKLKEILTQIREKYCGEYDKLLELGEKCREAVLENNSYLKTAETLKKVFGIEFTDEVSNMKGQRNG